MLSSGRTEVQRLLNHFEVTTVPTVPILCIIPIWCYTYALFLNKVHLTYRFKMSRKELLVRYLTEAEEYKCPLSEETQVIAEEELRETESARSQALTSIRSWIQQNPKFKAVRMGKILNTFGPRF